MIVVQRDNLHPLRFPSNRNLLTSSYNSYLQEQFIQTVSINHDPGPLFTKR